MKLLFTIVIKIQVVITKIIYKKMKIIINMEVLEYKKLL